MTNRTRTPVVAAATALVTLLALAACDSPQAPPGLDDPGLVYASTQPA